MNDQKLEVNLTKNFESCVPGDLDLLAMDLIRRRKKSFYVSLYSLKSEGSISKGIKLRNMKQGKIISIDLSKGSNSDVLLLQICSQKAGCIKARPFDSGKDYLDFISGKGGIRGNRSYYSQILVRNGEKMKVLDSQAMSRMASKNLSQLIDQMVEKEKEAKRVKFFFDKAMKVGSTEPRVLNNRVLQVSLPFSSHKCQYPGSHLVVEAIN